MRICKEQRKPHTMKKGEIHSFPHFYQKEQSLLSVTQGLLKVRSPYSGG